MIITAAAKTIAPIETAALENMACLISLLGELCLHTLSRMRLLDRHEYKSPEQYIPPSMTAHRMHNVST